MKIALGLVGADEEAIVAAIGVRHAGRARRAARVVLAVRQATVSPLERETDLAGLGAVRVDRAGGADAPSLRFTATVAAIDESPGESGEQDEEHHTSRRRGHGRP